MTKVVPLTHIGAGGGGLLFQVRWLSPLHPDKLPLCRQRPNEDLLTLHPCSQDAGLAEPVSDDSSSFRGFLDPTQENTGLCLSGTAMNRCSL